jgi:hypothetical protein
MAQAMRLGHLTNVVNSIQTPFLPRKLAASAEPALMIQWAQRKNFSTWGAVAKGPVSRSRWRLQIAKACRLASLDHQFTLAFMEERAQSLLRISQTLRFSDPFKLSRA